MAPSSQSDNYWKAEKILLVILVTSLQSEAVEFAHVGKWVASIRSHLDGQSCICWETLGSPMQQSINFDVKMHVLLN